MSTAPVNSDTDPFAPETNDPEITGLVFRVWAETAPGYWQAISQTFPDTTEASAWALQLNTESRVEPEDAD